VKLFSSETAHQRAKLFSMTDWLAPHYKMYVAAAHKDSMSVPAQPIFAMTNSMELSPFRKTGVPCSSRSSLPYTETNCDGLNEVIPLCYLHIYFNTIRFRQHN